MKINVLTMFMILLAFMATGCVDEDVLPEPDIVDDVDDDIIDENDMNDTVNDVNDTEEEDITENDEVVIKEPVEPRTYTIRMENFHTVPANHTINTGDTVVWRNNNDPARIFTLVSNEDIWEDKRIPKGYTFVYTFNETGTYNYKVLEFSERMKGTIVVKDEENHYS